MGSPARRAPLAIEERFFASFFSGKKGSRPAATERKYHEQKKDRGKTPDKTGLYTSVALRFYDDNHRCLDGVGNEANSTLGNLRAEGG